ncbi:MAG: hypothetical protein PUP91_00800 [Rhizonema sp. PD37]|nr:hypothetical protein [Rhizonema sp. PD37]
MIPLTLKICQTMYSCNPLRRYAFQLVMPQACPDARTPTPVGDASQLQSERLRQRDASRTRTRTGKQATHDCVSLWEKTRRSLTQSLTEGNLPTALPHR